MKVLVHVRLLGRAIARGDNAEYTKQLNITTFQLDKMRMMGLPGDLSQVACNQDGANE